MSGVYIAGMQMPKKCVRCPFGIFGHCAANNDKDIEKVTADAERDVDCPLIPVPDHGRLIDANKVGLTDFEIILCQADENPYKSGLKMLLDKIEKMPTIIPADKEADNG